MIKYRNSRTSYRKPGYTLVELVLVITLIGIVISIAIPRFDIIFNISEKKELMEFKRDIVAARNKAVMENSIYIIRIYISENIYRVIKEDEFTTIIKKKKFSAGNIFVSNNIGNALVFYPTGTPNKAGTIRMTNRRKENIKITITPATGKVNLKINEE